MMTGGVFKGFVRPFEGQTPTRFKKKKLSSEVARRLTKNELNVVLLVSFASSFEKFTNEQTSFLDSNDFGQFFIDKINHYGGNS